MNIHDIRKMARVEEIDYLFLTHALREYAQPRNKIQALLKTKDLIRIKKGLYIFGEKAAREPYSKESLSNLIYGPSAISLEYALSFYGLIPERVEELTCITTKRSKYFDTPIGRFSYTHLNLKSYPNGIQQITNARRNILISTKEKAICDMLTLRSKAIRNEKQLNQYLFEDLRLEENFYLDFNVDLLKELKIDYNHRNVSLFIDLILKKLGSNHA